MDPNDYLDQKYGGSITTFDPEADLKVLMLEKLEMRQRILLYYESQKVKSGKDIKRIRKHQDKIFKLEERLLTLI